MRPRHRSSLRRFSVVFVGLTAMFGTLVVGLGASAAFAAPCRATATFAPGTQRAEIGLAPCLSGGTFSITRAGEGATILTGFGSKPMISIGAGWTGVIKDLTLTGNNDTSSEAGGIYNDGSTITLINVSVSGDTESGGSGGGGIYNTGTMNIEDSVVNRNLSSGLASGIYNQGMMTITNSTVSMNVTSSQPTVGGILNQGTLDIYQSTISNNAPQSSVSHGSGGGIVNTRKLYLSGVSITGNSGFDGGGITNAGGIATIVGGLISGNIAFDGGGIFNVSTLTMKGSGGIDDNSATVDGGGIYNDGGTANLTGTTIQGNRAGVGGGGIYPLGSANLVATDCQDNSVGNCT